MKILSIIILATSLLSFDTPKCKGVTKTGKPCKSVIVSKEGYCNSHNPSVKNCPHLNSKGKPCGMKTGGKLCRFHS